MTIAEKGYLLWCINDYATSGLILRNEDGKLLRLEETWSDGSFGCQFIEHPTVHSGYDVYSVDKVKPYLRSLNDMTHSEANHYDVVRLRPSVINAVEFSKWLRDNRFDCFGLIDKGLAIRVTEDNNPYRIDVS